MDKQLYGFEAGFCDATDTPRRLTKENLPCDAVSLSIWTVDDNGVDTPLDPATNPNFVFFGFNAKPNMQLFTGAPSRLIGCKNVNEIYVRAAKGKARRIFFTCYKEAQN